MNHYHLYTLRHLCEKELASWQEMLAICSDAPDTRRRINNRVEGLKDTLRVVKEEIERLDNCD